MEPLQPTGIKRGSFFSSVVALVVAGGAAIVVLWFLYQIVTAVLLLFFALVVAIALSAPVNWFVRRGLARHWAAILTLLLFFAAVGLLAALVIPRLVSQLALLLNNLPAFINSIEQEVAALLTRYPDLQP